jgi:multidrug efflux pump subunit AcrB
MIRFALRNAHLVIVLVLTACLIGVVSLARIPADLLPTFKTSAVQIVTFYPGMPPEVMEQAIMTRLERWTGQAAGIEHQEAKAMQGVSVVKDFFHPEVSNAEAMSQVSSLAMSDMYYLPPGTRAPLASFLSIRRPAASLLKLVRSLHGSSSLAMRAAAGSRGG